MELTIKSKKLQAEYNFRLQGTKIVVDIEGSRLDKNETAMCCHGGRLNGSTLSYYGDNTANFKKICRAWYRAHVNLYSQD